MRSSTLPPARSLRLIHKLRQSVLHLSWRLLEKRAALGRARALV